MTKGRPTQPAKMKALKGTLRKCRQTDGFDNFEKLDTIPEPAAYLKVPAKKLWFEKCRILKNLGLLDRMDLELLEQYCHQFQIIDQSSRLIKKHGLTIQITNKSGFSYEVKSPHISILNEATKLMLSIGANFGFTPSSRARLKAPGTGKPQSKLGEMISGG